MSDPTNIRKLRHLQIVTQDPATDRGKFYFDAIQLQHRALPELNLDEVDPSTGFLGKRLAFPLLISSMTGGDHALIRRINRNLACAAEECGVAMAVGSQRVLFSRPGSAASFNLRRYAPTALLLANLGAVQLNHGFDAGTCRQAVAASGADGLCLHLNPLQEAVQPDGDTNFKGLAAKIGRVARQLDCPVIVKEVGAGVSLADARLLLRHGIRYIDVAGAGGTSWSRIEHHARAARGHGDLGLVFQDWGLPTPAALAALRPLRGKLTVVASGGIRSGIDMAKALILGAAVCGVAAPLLKPAMESAERVAAVIRQLRREFVTAMFLLGARDVRALRGNESLIIGKGTRP